MNRTKKDDETRCKSDKTQRMKSLCQPKSIQGTKGKNRVWALPPTGDQARGGKKERFLRTQDPLEKGKSGGKTVQEDTRGESDGSEYTIVLSPVR